MNTELLKTWDSKTLMEAFVRANLTSNDYADLGDYKNAELFQKRANAYGEELSSRQSFFAFLEN